MTTLSQKPKYGRPMTAGSIIHLKDNIKVTKQDIGVGSCLIIQVGYCEHCGNRIALSLTDADALFSTMQSTFKYASRGYELPFGFRRKLRTFIKGLIGKPIRNRRLALKI